MPLEEKITDDTDDTDDTVPFTDDTVPLPTNQRQQQEKVNYLTSFTGKL